MPKRTRKSCSVTRAVSTILYVDNALGNVGKRDVDRHRDGAQFGPASIITGAWSRPVA